MAKVKEITLEDLRNAKSFPDLVEGMSDANFRYLVEQLMKLKGKRATQ